MNANGKLALEKWAEGKHLFLAIFAHQVAMSAEACYQACVLARNWPGLEGQDGVPRFKEWRGLYRRKDMFIRSAKKLLPHGFGDGGNAELLEMHDAIEATQKVGKRKLRAEIAKLGKTGFVLAMKESVEQWRAIYSAHIEDVKAQIDGVESCLSDEGSLLQDAEMIFYLRVWFPCWLEYGVSLPELVGQAEEGELDALEKLLRLDKYAIKLPKISRHYDAAREEGNKARFKRLHDALAGPPLTRLTRQGVKVALAALVYKWFSGYDGALRTFEREYGRGMLKLAKVKLKAPEVRALFDAVAMDFKGLPRDPDLPASDHAFYMALRRDAHFWPSMP